MMTLLGMLYSNERRRRRTAGRKTCRRALAAESLEERRLLAVFDLVPSFADGHVNSLRAKIYEAMINGEDDVITLGPGTYDLTFQSLLFRDAAAPIPGLNSSTLDLVVGDFVEDGHLDVAASYNDGGAARIAVFAGSEDGVLSNPTIVAGAAGCLTSAGSTLQTGQLSADSHLDLTMIQSAGCAGSRAISLLGDGLGGFGVGQNLSLGGSAGAQVLEDMNDDDELDLVVASTSSSQINVYPGNGNGSFQTTPVSTSGSPAGYAVGFLNADLIPDLVTADVAAEEVRVLFGNGLGGFNNGQVISVPGVDGIHGVDMDRNGSLDLVITRSGDRGVSVLLGDGLGDFPQRRDFETHIDLHAEVVAADFDIDGNQDIAFGNDDGVIAIMRGDGSGNLRVPETFRVGGQGTGLGLATADFNLDTRPDLVTTGPNGVYVLLNVPPVTDLRLTEANHSIVIKGNGVGPAETILDGNGTGRVFHISPNVQVTLENLSVVGGATIGESHQEFLGGGIFNEGSLILRDSVVRGNVATLGGGVGHTGESLLIENTAIWNNLAPNGGGVGSRDATLRIVDSEILENFGQLSGGGIEIRGGEATIRQTTIDGNVAIDSVRGATGGGIMVRDTPGHTARVLIDSSTLSHNYSDLGGGIATQGSNTSVELVNSTISTNLESGEDSLGSIIRGGGLYNNGATVALRNVTVTRNEAHQGAGLYNASGTLRLLNTIVAENELQSDRVDSSQGPAAGPDGRNLGNALSMGGNLIGDRTDFNFAAMGSDQMGTAANPIDPLLGELTNTGGQTSTHEPLVVLVDPELNTYRYSPAIDAGQLANAPSVDQRGIPRADDGNLDGVVAVDVGAVEVQGFVTILVPADLDNTLYEVNEFVLEENSNGAGHYLFAGVTDQGDLRRGLLHFDVASAITTENTRIVAAHLQMNMSRTPFGAGPREISLHRTLAEWGEGDSDAPGEEGQGIPASAGEVTWLNRMYPNRPWAVPGGEFESAPIAATTVDDVGFYTWESQDLLRTVQNWRDDPESNYGLTVVGNEAETRTTKRFDSGEHPFLQNRPQLVLLVTGGAFSDLAGAKVTSVLLNRTQQDPPDRPVGPQPTSWAQQRSDIRDIQITFSEDVNIDVTDIQLINLGVNAPLDPDTQIPLTPAHLSVAGSVATLSFGHAELPIGVYELRIAPSVTTMLNVPLDGNSDGAPGDEFVIRADRFNRFYKITADFNGDLGTSVFDFGTFAYWFGAPVFPEYVDLNNDGGASVFDFPLFAQFFGRGVVLPPPPFASLSATQPASPLAGFAPDGEPSQLESPSLESPAQQRVAADLLLFAAPRPRRAHSLRETAPGDRERPSRDDLEHVLNDLAADVNAVWRRG